MKDGWMTISAGRKTADTCSNSKNLANPKKIEIGYGSAQKVPAWWEKKNSKKPFALLVVKRFSKETQQVVFMENHQMSIQKFSWDSIGHLCLYPVVRLALEPYFSRPFYKDDIPSEITQYFFGCNLRPHAANALDDWLPGTAYTLQLSEASVSAWKTSRCPKSRRNSVQNSLPAWSQFVSAN
jgi:hypothetical protein